MPPGQRRYEVQLSSKSGPIDVFLIQDPNGPVAAASTAEPDYSALDYPNTDPLGETRRPSSYAAHDHVAITQQYHSHASHSLHTAEMLKPFDIPVDAFAFELKSDEGAADLYGLGTAGADVYNVFVDRRI